MSARRPAHGHVLAAIVASAMLGGCGSSNSQVELGFPTANPPARRADALLPVLNGARLRIAVPSGWQVARLNGNGARRALVRLVAPCYESISITGSSIQSPSAAQFNARYGHPFQGYTWAVSKAAGRLIALLAQYPVQQTPLARGTVGIAYIPLEDGRRLAVDLSAGVWPLRRGACSDTDAAALVQPLQATVLQVFQRARVITSDTSPGASSPGAP